MNPSSNETPGASGINLPPPLAEQAPQAAAAPAAAEQRPAAPEAAPRPGAAQPAAAMPAMPAMPAPVAPTAGQQPAQTVATPTTHTAAIPMLDDNDKIEKAWVNRTKQVVAQTRNDPYRQSEELTAVKADYMKQRYNKIIKVEK